MKSFYEQNREESGLVISVQKDFSFPPHYHANLEIFLLETGSYEATVNGKTYMVSDGCILFSDSYDIHAYERLINSEDERGCMVIIPYSYLQKFNHWRQGRGVDERLLSDPVLCEQLIDIAKRYLQHERDENILEAGVDLFLAILCKQLKFTKEKMKEEIGLMRNILAYLHENFQGDVTRRELARIFGYTETHISKVFHRYLQKGISAYVNEIRLAYIDRQRQAGDTRSAFELIYDAGFKSLRTYYRSCSKK